MNAAIESQETLLRKIQLFWGSPEFGDILQMTIFSETHLAGPIPEDIFRELSFLHLLHERVYPSPQNLLPPFTFHW